MYALVSPGIRGREVRRQDALVGAPPPLVIARGAEPRRAVLAGAILLVLAARHDPMQISPIEGMGRWRDRSLVSN
jgi:hypothetical protein